MAYTGINFNRARMPARQGIIDPSRMGPPQIGVDGGSMRQGIVSAPTMREALMQQSGPQQSVAEILSEPLGEMMPDLGGATSAASRQRQIADMLLQGAQSQDNTSIAGGLSQLGQAFLARKAGQKADTAEDKQREMANLLLQQAMGQGPESQAARAQLFADNPAALIAQSDAQRAAQAEAAKPQYQEVGDALLQIGPDGVKSVYEAPQQPVAPKYEKITLADGEYEYIFGQPESLRKVGDSPDKSPLVSVTTGDGSPGSRPIIGDPPKDYQARYNEQTGSYEFEPIPGSDAAREREGAAIKAATTIRLADEQFELMTTSIDKAIEQADFWSAGLMAQATSGIGSTPARNLRATIDTIVANIGFEKLQEMRETSPTGGALGNVTERELTFLQSVRGSLDQIQDPAQLREVLARVKQSLSIIHEIRRMHMQSNMSNSGTRIPDGNAMGADAPPLVWNSQKGDFE